jgi:hypothetical protein
MGVQRINFEPLTDILKVHRRDFALANPDLATPNAADVLLDGEWMVLNAAYQILRATDITVPGDMAALPSFPLFAERGRYDVQAIAGRKMPILFRGEYEFDTRIFDAAAGAGITAVLQPLKVSTVAIGARSYSGLVVHNGAADADPIMGYVTRLPANNGGRLRFISGSRH